MSGRVYVVFAMDTEGPVTDKNPSLLGSWQQVDNAMAKIFNTDYRMKYPDSFGGHLKASWFVLNWTGFKTNPVKRDFGYHKVFDHYVKSWGEQIGRYGDGVYWHYHHPAVSGVGNEWNTDWTSNTEYYNILNRMIIDRRFFPSCFRAGGTIETNDTSHWLEQWIPFDYSGRAGRLDWDRKEADGRMIKDVCDWSRALADWSYYHPSAEDYQLPGKMKRIICRCLDIKSGSRTISDEEITEAFEQAAAGRDAIMSFFEHDFRDIAAHVERVFLSRVAEISQNYPDVEWCYANALDAIRGVLGYRGQSAPILTAELIDSRIIVRSDKSLFGREPYFVVKFIDSGEYRHFALDVIGRNVWQHRLGICDRQRIFGIAGGDRWGNTEVVLYYFDGASGTLWPVTSEVAV